MAQQPTLNQFYKVKKTTKDIFYIDWTHQPFNARWMINKPEQISYCSSVNWKNGGYNVQLCCYEGDKVSPPFDIPQEFYYKNVSLFKSLLQKSVRRQLTDLSIKTAYHLIKMDLNSFLRRLFVIMLEDTCLHSCANVLVWLTSAVSKGYQLKEYQIDWLLGLTRHLCLEQNKFYHDFYQYEKPNIRQLVKQIDQSSIDLHEKDILYSILFRESYGGMDSDLHMFYDYVFIWFERFKQRIKLTYGNFDSVSVNTVQELKTSEILYNSVDFHCFPNIIGQLVGKFPQLTENDIKECIWECNSKNNSRCPSEVDPQIMANWQIIENDLVKLQKNLILHHH